MAPADSQQQTRDRARLLRRHVYRAALAGLLVWLGFRVYLAEPIREQSRPAPAFFRCPCPLVLAHRGASYARPENTLLAFRQALKQGADILELDVRLTKDRRVVVFHDKNLKRVTGREARVRDLALAEVQALDAAFAFTEPETGRSFRGRGVRIPLFSEVLQTFPKTRINIELKDDDVELPRALYAVIAAAGAFDRTLVASVHGDMVEEWRRLLRQGGVSGAATGAAFGDVLGLYLRHRVGMDGKTRADALQIPARPVLGLDLTTAAWIDYLHRRGLRVHYWTVNDPAHMRTLIERGADGIITDRPDVALRVLQDLGLRR